jgi:hypothetical protein
MSRYDPSDPVDQEKIRNQFLIIENYRDFVGWLFDDPDMIDWMSETEAWDKFREWQDKQAQQNDLGKDQSTIK